MTKLSLAIFFLLHCTANLFSAESTEPPYTLMYFTDTVTGTKTHASCTIPFEESYLQINKFNKMHPSLQVAISPLQEPLEKLKYSDQKLRLYNCCCTCLPDIKTIAYFLYEQAKHKDKLTTPYPFKSLVHKAYVSLRFAGYLGGGIQSDEYTKRLWKFIEAIDTAESAEELKQICMQGIDNPNYNFFGTDKIDTSAWTHNQFRNKRIEAVANYLIKEKGMTFEHAWKCLPAKKSVAIELPKHQSIVLIHNEDEDKTVNITTKNFYISPEQLEQIKKIILKDSV